MQSGRCHGRFPYHWRSAQQRLPSPWSTQRLLPDHFLSAEQHDLFHSQDWDQAPAKASRQRSPHPHRHLLWKERDKRKLKQGVATLHLPTEACSAELHSHSRQLVRVWHQDNKANIIYLKNDFTWTYILELFFRVRQTFIVSYKLRIQVLSTQNNYHGHKNALMQRCWQSYAVWMQVPVSESISLPIKWQQYKLTYSKDLIN